MSSARRSARSSSAQPALVGEAEDAARGVCSCVSFAFSTFASSCGPKSVTVARTGTPAPMPPSDEELDRVRGRLVRQAELRHPLRAPARRRRPARRAPRGRPCSRPRRPRRPASESCSASSWSVRVLPVPVAPAIRPWRFIVASGSARRTASGSSVPSWTPRPRSTAAPVDRVCLGDRLGERRHRRQTLRHGLGSASHDGRR